MRRGPGISGLQRNQQALDKYKATGEDVKKTKLAAVRDQVDVFRRKLEEFAQKYKDEIRSNPVFRAQFHTMCASIGVDPLVSNKGMWAEVLGFGDFYYELGVQIIEACIATRVLNGGLLELDALQRHVQRRRGSSAAPISTDDIVRSIKKLRLLGNGFDLVTIGKQAFVRSVPGELSTDKNRVLELAQGTGCISHKELMTKANWSSTRAESALQALLLECLAMVDDGAAGGVRLYWFPCLSNQQTAMPQEVMNDGYE